MIVYTAISTGRNKNAGQLTNAIEFLDIRMFATHGSYHKGICVLHFSFSRNNKPSKVTYQLNRQNGFILI